MGGWGWGIRRGRERGEGKRKRRGGGYHGEEIFYLFKFNRMNFESDGRIPWNRLTNIHVFPVEKKPELSDVSDCSDKTWLLYLWEITAVSSTWG